MGEPDQTGVMLMRAFQTRLRYKTCAKWQKPFVNPLRFARNQFKKFAGRGEVDGEIREVEAFHLADFSIVNGEGVGEQIASYGIYEESLTEAFLRLVRPGMVVLDVGMHVGYYTTLFARLVGERGEVHAFEPTPSTRTIAARNVARFKQVVVHPEALWSCERVVKFRDYGPKWLAFNSFTEAKTDQEIPPPQEFDVTTGTLDQFRQRRGKTISLIKIDAESAELEILRGAATMLKVDRPLLTVEVGDVGANIQSRALHEHLAAAGYRAWELCNGKFQLHQPRERYSYDNLIFAPCERELSTS